MSIEDQIRVREWKRLRAQQKAGKVIVLTVPCFLRPLLRALKGRGKT